MHPGGADASDGIVAWRLVTTPDCCAQQHCWYSLAHMLPHVRTFDGTARHLHARKCLLWCWASCVCLQAGSFPPSSAVPYHPHLVGSNLEAPPPRPVPSLPRPLRATRSQISMPLWDGCVVGDPWVQASMCDLHLPTTGSGSQTPKPHTRAPVPWSLATAGPHNPLRHPCNMRGRWSDPHVRHPGLTQTPIQLSGRLRGRRWSARGSRRTCCHPSGPAWRLLRPSRGSR